MNTKWSGWKTFKKIGVSWKDEFMHSRRKNLHHLTYFWMTKKDKEWELIIWFGKIEVIAMFDKYNFKKLWKHNLQFSQSVLTKEWQPIKLKH